MKPTTKEFFVILGQKLASAADCKKVRQDKYLFDIKGEFCGGIAFGYKEWPDGSLSTWLYGHLHNLDVEKTLVSGLEVKVPKFSIAMVSNYYSGGDDFDASDPRKVERKISELLSTISRNLVPDMNEVAANEDLLIERMEEPLVSPEVRMAYLVSKDGIVNVQSKIANVLKELPNDISRKRAADFVDRLLAKSHS